MNTNAFNNNLLPTCPNLPNIQYYNKSAPVKNINSEQIFIENMATSCGKVVTNSENNCLTPGNCDFYTESAFNGTLADNSTIATAVTANPTNAATQIQYMAVQLARARARSSIDGSLNTFKIVASFPG